MTLIKMLIIIICRVAHPLAIVDHRPGVHHCLAYTCLHISISLCQILSNVCVQSDYISFTK